MATTNTDRIRQLETTVAALQTQLAYAEKQLDVLRDGQTKLTQGVADSADATTTLRARTDALDRKVSDTDRREQVIELHREFALLRQQLDDFRKRIDKWDTRLWAVVAGVLLFLLSSVITLVVTLARK